MVCSGMVIRKGSCPHLSVAFKCWVNPDCVSCLPAWPGDMWESAGSIPQPLCQRHGRVSKLWPYFTRMWWETGQLSIWRTPATTPV